MRIHIKFIIFSLILTSFLGKIVLSNESPNIENIMKSLIETARIKENPPKIKISDEQIKAADPNKILEVLAPYEKDPDWPVRNMTHNNLIIIANLHSNNIKVRQEVTKRLVEAEFDRSDRGAYRKMNLTTKDFNNQSKTFIRQAIVTANKEKTGGDSSVWLCGIANIQEELSRLEELQKDKDKVRGLAWYYTTGWAAQLARARMGVKEEIQDSVNRIENEIDKNERWQLLDNLGYIRQPEAINILKKYLDSDKKLPIANEINSGELYASYVIDILSDCLKDFPIKKKPGRSYSLEQINIVRKWMSEQKEWKIIK